MIFNMWLTDKLLECTESLCLVTSSFKAKKPSVWDIIPMSCPSFTYSWWQCRARLFKINIPPIFIKKEGATCLFIYNVYLQRLNQNDTDKSLILLFVILNKSTQGGFDAYFYLLCLIWTVPVTLFSSAYLVSKWNFLNHLNYKYSPHYKNYKNVN